MYYYNMLYRVLCCGFAVLSGCCESK